MKYWKSFQEDSINLSVVECGMEKHTSFQIYEYNVRRKFVIHFVTEGTGRLKINNHKYPLRENTGFILRQNQHVKYFSDADRQLTYYWLGLAGHSLDSLMAKTLLQDADVFTFNNKSSSLQLLEEMVDFNRKYADSFNTAMKNKAYLFDFMYHLSEEFPNAEKIDILRSGQHALSNRIIDYIHENYTKDIQVQDIADHFNISRSYLYKICYSKFEKSPQEIILRERIRNASQLLLHTNLLIKDISDQVGYKNQFHFSKVFKQYYGCSPSEFRKLDNPLLDQIIE